MKILILSTLLALCPMLINAQGCLPEGITFTSQSQIDNFQANYPGCTEIEGDVKVSGSDISNLNGLNVITSIEGDLTISFNNVLITLEGLENLNHIGSDLIITNNPSLASTTGLESLIYLGGNLTIHTNDALSSLAGFVSLGSVGGNMAFHYYDIPDL